MRRCAGAPISVKELEQLCRYITRPAIANERLKRNRAGQVVLQLKSRVQRRHHPYRHGAAGVHGAPGGPGAAPALTSDPVRRLRAGRFHGVLAPNAKLRREIVPSPPEHATAPACDHASAGRAGAHELGPAAQTGLRSPYQLHLAPAKRQVPFASPTPFIHSAGKNSTSCCSAFSGVRNAFSIATRKDTGHRCLRGGRVWRQRTRTSQWERVDHGFAFKICSISQRC